MTVSFLSRELSALRFNERVLLCALSPDIPLLERFRFLFILSRNLDEFFEIRVSNLQQQLHTSSRGATIPVSPDGFSPKELLEQISQFAHQLVHDQYIAFNDLMNCLRFDQIFFLKRSEWSPEQHEFARHYFEQDLLPILTPLALDMTHPFPRLLNKSLNFIVKLKGKDAFGRNSGLAVIHPPPNLGELLSVPSSPHHPEQFCLAFVSDILVEFAELLFPGMQIQGCYPFRLTRNGDLMVDDLNADDLAKILKVELLSRRYGDAVRLEVSDNTPDHLVEFLLKKCQLPPEDLYKIEGPINIMNMTSVFDWIHKPHFYYKPFTPHRPKRIKAQWSLFDAISKKSLLLHHPYQSFEPVIGFIQEAAQDPKVLAIKQTLYRIEAESPVIDALLNAARNGKEITVVIELMARFDEADNLNLATRLQEAGAIVVYGVMGHKTHAKMALVIRREGERLKLYSHLSTGNYHAIKAQYYTDFSLLTADQQIGADIQQVFQQLSGMGQARTLKHLIQAPFYLHIQIKSWIQQEIQNAQNNKPAKIMAKLNALTDSEIIQMLYQASNAGVSIDLVVRGMCSLRPGVKGLSENIRVFSVIGRFLEHSRVYYFENHPGEPLVYLASADWMERNLHQRVEICFPLLEATCKQRVIEEALLNHIGDASFQLTADGHYEEPAHHIASIAQEALLKKWGTPLKHQGE